MRLPEFNYAEAKSIQEACHLLATPHWLVLSGGMDLLVNMKHKVQQPAGLVDIKGIKDLGQVRQLYTGELSLGSLVTLRLIEQLSVIREKAPLLAIAARSVGSPPIRNKATLGGNVCLNTRCWYFNIPTFSRKTRERCNKQGGSICHVVKGEEQRRCYSLFSADTVPALLALEARVKICSAMDIRVIPLRELYSGDGVNPLTLHQGELVTEVIIPSFPAKTGSAYLKLRERETLDFPIIGIAVVLSFAEDGQTCKKAKVVFIGVSSSPFEATDAEAYLEDKILTAEVETEAADLVSRQAKIYSLNGISSSYKRSMMKEYTVDAIKLAKQNINAQERP